MCEKATSHLFKVKEREMLIHTIGSHSQTREALQITDNDSSVIEVEWPEESQAPSIRFAKQDSEERQLIIDWYAKRFPTRLDLVKYCIERSKGYLDLSGLTALPEGVTFPKSCGYLDLSGLTALPEGVTFPEKIDGYLDLSGLTALPEGVTFPKSCGSLYLSGLTALPEGVTFPKSCGYLYLSGDLKAKLKL